MANDAVGRALERWRRVVELFTQKYATNAGKFRPFRRKETETKRDRSDSFRFEAKVIPISSRNLISILRRYSWPVFPWLSRGFEIDLLACSINNPPTVPLQKRELFLVILSIPRELFPNSSRLEKNTAGRSKWLQNKMDSVYFSSPVEPCIDSSQLRLYFKLSRSFISSDIGGTSGRASIQVRPSHDDRSTFSIFNSVLFSFTRTLIKFSETSNVVVRCVTSTRFHHGDRATRRKILNTISLLRNKFNFNCPRIVRAALFVQLREDTRVCARGKRSEACTEE